MEMFYVDTICSKADRITAQPCHLQRLLQFLSPFLLAMQNVNKTPSYSPEWLKNDTFCRVSCSAGGDDSVYLEPWLEMTGEMLAAVDIGQQEQLP